MSSSQNKTRVHLHIYYITFIYIFNIYSSIHPFIHLSMHQSIYLSIHPSIYSYMHLSIYQSIHLSIYPSVHQNIHPSIYPSISPSIHSFIHPYIHLSIYHISIYLSNQSIHNHTPTSALQSSLSVVLIVVAIALLTVSRRLF